MKKIYEILGLNTVKGEYGIEIEAEGRNLELADTPTWRSEDDPSLRGVFPESRCEWVLRQPILFKDVRKALKEINDIQKAATLKFSFRTSCHVHMNVQQMTYPQVLNVIYAYLLIEEPLLNYCGDVRKGNRFCLRARDAEGLLWTLREVFSGNPHDLVNFPNNSIRYAAINLEAITKYGSLEFRSMRGTLDQEVLNNWVGMLNNLKQYALSKESPEQIHEEFRKVGCAKFLRNVVGAHADVLEYPEMEKDMCLSYSITLDLPHAYQPRKEKEAEAKIVIPVGMPPPLRKRPVPPAAPIRWDQLHREEFARAAEIIYDEADGIGAFPDPRG